MVCIMSEYVENCTTPSSSMLRNPCQQIEVTLIRDQDPDFMERGTRTSTETEESENRSSSSMEDGDYTPTDAGSESRESQGSSGLDDTSADADDEWSGSEDDSKNSTDDNNDSTKWFSDEQEMVKGRPKLKRKRSHSAEDTKKNPEHKATIAGKTREGEKLENPDPEDVEQGEEALFESLDDGIMLRRDVAPHEHKSRI